jgi:catechol 2,3-dioxygenase-like lactoylglutathione lyase family enzyme
VLETLDHVVVAVRDLERAAETYGTLLGLRPSWRGGHPELGTANVLYRLRNTYLELLSPVGKGLGARTLREHLDEHGESPFALAFGTPDAAACAGELRKRGLHPTDARESEGRDEASGAKRRWRSLFLPRTDTRGVTLFAIQHLTRPDALPPAEPMVDPASTVHGIDHVVISTEDPDASGVLYGDRLGIRLALDRTFEKRGVRLLFFRVGGVTVELASRLGSNDADAPDSFWGISYQVSDVDAAQRRLIAAGFDVSETRGGHKEGTRVCTVRRETHGVATLLLGPES